MRQATVSNVDSEKLNINKVLDNLPASVKENVKHKLEIINLKDAIVRASNDQQKIIALSNLAFFTKDKTEKEEAYKTILTNYSSMPEAYHAYLYFLYKKDSKQSVSIADYHKFINSCPSDRQLQMWQAGLQRLNKKRAKPNIKLDYLIPLLDRKPEYRDYMSLYKTLRNFARKAKRTDIEEKAEERQNQCIKLPTYDMVLWKKMMKEEEDKKKKAPGKTGNKSKKAVKTGKN